MLNFFNFDIAINFKNLTMKKALLIMIAFCGITVSAQTTHHINWGTNAGVAQFSKTIAPGDTVMWMWTTTHPHTVTSEPGSAENFDSGTLQGIGLSYSKTFTVLGANPYVCIFHDNMAGVITVDANASTQKNDRKSFNVWPNPTTDVINISTEAAIDKIEMYDMNGRKIMDTQNSGNADAKLYIDNLSVGTYILKVTSGGKQKILNVVKN